MRKFPYITVGKILGSLKEQGINISRVTFTKLEKSGYFPEGRRSPGGWRVYLSEDALAIIQVIKERYGISDSVAIPTEQIPLQN